MALVPPPPPQKKKDLGHNLLTTEETKQFWLPLTSIMFLSQYEVK